MEYNELNFVIPKESPTYKVDSETVVAKIVEILNQQRAEGKNKISITTSLKAGLPIVDINKIAGPLIQAWAEEIFEDICQDAGNQYSLINVETQGRLGISDIVLQFSKSDSVIIGNVDIKASANNIPKSGRRPNITSFSRIRSAYVNNPDFMFIVLSVRHSVYTEFDENTGCNRAVMQIDDYNVYDLKFIDDASIAYNPALGTGQIQIQNIHQVSYQYRTTWEMCQLLDKKYLNSSRRTIESFYKEAVKNKWLKK